MRPTTLLLVLLPCTPLAGQAPPKARTLTFSDTLGAGFEAADSARGASLPTDFDFLLGTWAFRFQERNSATGAWLPEFGGRWRVVRKQTRNGFIEDHWVPDYQRGAADEGTWTYRVFNPQRKLWETAEIGTAGGPWATGVAWSDGAGRCAVEHVAQSLMRLRYFAITDSSFGFRADESRDGGRTWQLDHWVMTVRRVAR